MVGCLASVGVVAAAVAWASLKALAQGEQPLRHRVAGLGVGALVVVGAGWLIRAYAAATLAPVLGWDDDFALIRVDGADLLLIPGVGPAQRRRAVDLVGAELRCRVTEVTGEEGYACEREVRLRWANGDVTRTGDEVEWGLSPCTGALDNHIAHLDRVLALSGSSLASLRVVGDCPLPP